jgi:Niemann-Pick C1 protein
MMHLMAGMELSSIELNAVSLVNLIMSIGISVEFTSHFMIAFAHELSSSSESTFTSNQIVPHVLQTTGSSILSGITLTKLIGIIVLGFASSRIFSLYYFRFYLLLVAVGAVHGLVYLPSLCYVLISRRQKS